MSETVRRTVVVTDPMGLHARIALAIAQIVGQSESQVTLFKDDLQVTATEVLQIMTMVVEQGERVEFEAVGPDAAVVAEEIEPLLAGKFGDEDQEPV